MDALLSFAAALLSLRLGGQLARRHRTAWAAALFAFAAATAAMAWGSAHGWDARSFRVYYLAGALLAAPLLGVGSLLLWGRSWAAPLGLLYSGLAVGVALAMPVHGGFGSTAVPRAQDHLDALPRVIAIAASSLGTMAVLVVVAATLRGRPRQALLIVAAVAAAGVASALTQTAVAAAAAAFAAASVLLYLGVAGRPRYPVGASSEYQASTRSANSRSESSLG